MKGLEFKNKSFADVLEILVETYEIKTNKQKALRIAEMAKGMGVPEHWITNKKKNNSIGDICVSDIAVLSKYFDMPMEQIITGENPEYKLIKEDFGLTTPATEWLKNKSSGSDEQVDYIGILNIILSDKDIADSLIGAIYKYCMKDVYKFLEIPLRDEIMNDIIDVMDLVSEKYEPTKIENMEKKLDSLLKEVDRANSRIDEKLQIIAEEKQQYIEDYEKEAKEYEQEKNI